MLVIYSGAASITREIRHMLRLFIVLSRDSLVSISCGLVPFPKRRLQARSCQVELINHMRHDEQNVGIERELFVEEAEEVHCGVPIVHR